MGDVKTGCSDHALVELTIPRDMDQLKSRVGMPNFRRVNFQFFKELVDGTCRRTALRDKGVEQAWQLFKDILFQGHSLGIIGS